MVFTAQPRVIALLVLYVSCALPAASTNSKYPESSQYYKFPFVINRVAVVGAGTAGVQHAAALVDQGFEVRLFERRPDPGGVWLYSPKKPLSPAFPYVRIHFDSCDFLNI